MAKLNYEQLHNAAVDALLPSGRGIIQDEYHSNPDEWYYKEPMGSVGPFETPEAAVKAAIHALYSQLAEQTADAAALSEELAALRTKLDQADGGDGLEPWRRAFTDAADEADQAGE